MPKNYFPRVIAEQSSKIRILLKAVGICLQGSLTGIMYIDLGLGQYVLRSLPVHQAGQYKEGQKRQEEDSLHVYEPKRPYPKSLKRYTDVLIYMPSLAKHFNHLTCSNQATKGFN